jgi:asparagine synthase (glutamine-hydrolysing)
MCGIFSLLNTNIIPYEVINKEFLKGKNRGPEFSTLKKISTQLYFGFHRLAINGLDSISNQPIIKFDENTHDEIVLICNGEIYNYKELNKMMNVTPKTNSDCEVIIDLYLKYGIQQTLNMLDGVFSFLLLDTRIKINDEKIRLFVARDPYGVRPLYHLSSTNDYEKLLGFASELKCLNNFIKDNTFKISQFKPGTYSSYLLENKDSLWKNVEKNVEYFMPTFSYGICSEFNIPKLLDDYYCKISFYLENAVYKRCLTTERPIACLLSGGLDSSLIAALVNNFYMKNNYKQKLETYSIGLNGSEDLKYAKIVSEYLGTNHTEIIVSEEDMFNAIPEVIKNIESYDTTTVRASIGNYLIGKYISKNSEAKVIFNGDGSDELLGGYLYMNKCPDDIEFDKETRRLLKDIHLFDVLRSDKSISSNGLEPRTPFLDKSFVNYMLSISPYFRNHKNMLSSNELCIEKVLLRKSFDKNNFMDHKGRQILPDEILWRKKEAFSDGVSSHGRSLYQILQEKIADHLNKTSQDALLPNILTEKLYYKTIFNKYYPECEDILPYYWMPKYTDAVDPSARTLDCYKK